MYIFKLTFRPSVRNFMVKFPDSGIHFRFEKEHPVILEIVNRLKTGKNDLTNKKFM